MTIRLTPLPSLMYFHPPTQMMSDTSVPRPNPASIWMPVDQPRRGGGVRGD
jgi:hypothetical protein